MKQLLITDFFDPLLIRGFNRKTLSWHCIECGIDMGPTNSRQLCGKTVCYY